MWFIAHCQDADPTEESINDALRDNFEQLDTDNSGEIEFDELYSALF